MSNKHNSRKFGPTLADYKTNASPGKELFMSLIRGATRFVTNLIRRATQAVVSDIATEALSGIIESSDIKRAVKDTEAWKKLRATKNQLRRSLRKKLGHKDPEEEDEDE